MKKALKVWYLYTVNSFERTLTNRFITLIFVLSKFIRIALFLLFLVFIFNSADHLAGFTREQVIFFYLSFNLIDTAAQLLFRNVYSFRPLVVSGDLDLVLLKPVNPLIRILLGGADVLDLFMLIFIIAAVLWVGLGSVSVSPLFWLGFLALALNSLLIAAAFHIFVLGLGVITVSVDHLVMIYRDLTALMRIPVDVYIEPVRSLLTFILPLGIMFTFPPKMLMGLLSWPLVVLSFIVSVVSFSLSLLFWRYSLRHYQSASS